MRSASEALAHKGLAGVPTQQSCDCLCGVNRLAENEGVGQDKVIADKLLAVSIQSYLKKRFGSSLQVANLSRFGRELQNIEGLKSRRVSQGTEYLVVKK